MVTRFTLKPPSATPHRVSSVCELVVSSLTQHPPALGRLSTSDSTSHAAVTLMCPCGPQQLMFHCYRSLCLLLPSSSSLALVHPLSVSVCGEPRESDTPMCYTWSGTDCPPSPYQFLHTFPPTQTLFIGTQPSNRPKLLFSTRGLMFHCYSAVLCSLLIASSDFRGRLTAAGCSPPPSSPGVLSDVMFPSSARVGQEVDVG